MMLFPKCIALFLLSLFELIEGQYKFEVNTEDFERLVLEVNRLGDLAQKQNEVIHELKTKVGHQEAANSDLDARLTQQQAKIDDLTETIRQREEAADNIAYWKQSLSKTIAAEPETVGNNRTLRSMKTLPGTSSKREATKRQNPNNVAFYAVMTVQSEDSVGVHQNVLFEDVVTNIGGGYNNHHGIFVAPVSGIYLLTTSLLSRHDQQFFVAFAVNGAVITRVYGHGADGLLDQSSQSLILFLNKGDDVTVQNQDHIDNFLGMKYSTFGGVLLHEYETSPSAVVGR